MKGATLILDLEKKGLAALNQKKYQEAAKLFEKITELFPDYEHGIAFYNLACALEEVGEFKQARIAYEKALFYAPDDHIRMGGYASFMYLHGNVQEAFDTYLSLLKLYNNDNDNNGISSCHQALYSLGNKMGWTQDKVLKVIKFS